FSIEPISGSAASTVKLRYSDNASGIDPNKLQKFMKAGDSSKDLNTIIFEKGVTSKEKGSGYGLYLVRKMLDRHNGSIDLISYRGGVVFEIVLGKDLKKTD